MLVRTDVKHTVNSSLDIVGIDLLTIAVCALVRRVEFNGQVQHPNSCIHFSHCVTVQINERLKLSVVMVFVATLHNIFGMVALHCVFRFKCLPNVVQGDVM